ncbi:MAG TPA: hypothetical protein VJY65_06970 [Chloroflexota bacterium]|nr:hypothetical protein [Chloroflexota bacterium]
MKRFSRWAALLVLVLLGLAVVAHTRPTPPYGGRVLYLHLRLAPYMVPGTFKEIQYWIDAAAGRIRYAELVPQSGNVQAAVNGVPVKPSPPQLPLQPWFVISLVRQPSGTCAVTYTNLLDSTERTQSVRCAGLLALRDVKALKARAAALWHQHRAAARITGLDHSTVSIPVPAGTEIVPLLTEDRGTSGERMAPGTLVLDRRSGLPISISGYRRGSPSIMTEHILSARLLPPGTLPGDFFDAPRYSLPDRAPVLYHWLHDVLPWHL